MRHMPQHIYAKRNFSMHAVSNLHISSTLTNLHAASKGYEEPRHTLCIEWCGLRYTSTNQTSHSWTLNGKGFEEMLPEEQKVFLESFQFMRDTVLKFSRLPYNGSLSMTEAIQSGKYTPLPLSYLTTVYGAIQSVPQILDLIEDTTGESQ